MPEFGNAFSGLAAKRKLTHSELVRSIRFMIAAEYEAIQLYEQLAESTDNALARKVLRDITDEEKEHVGEFCRLLRELAPEDEAFYREGEEETEEAIAELGEAASACCHGEGCCKDKDEHETCCKDKAEDGCCKDKTEGGTCCQNKDAATSCSLEGGEGQNACACEENKQRS